MQVLFFLIFFAVFVFLLLWFREFQENVQEEFSYDAKCSKKEVVWEKYPEFQKEVFRPNYEQLIPFQIFQTNEEKVLPGMKEALDSWSKMNPEYRHIFFPTSLCRDFISQNFEKRVLDAYDSLVPGAYKADLFRYCALYVSGGVYVDSAMVCLVPLKDWLPRDKTLVSAKDEGVQSGIYQAFFACVPRHPMLRSLIDLVVSRVENKEYGPRDLYTTGPMVFGNALNLYLGRGENTEFGTGDIGDSVFLFHRYSRPGKKIGGIFDAEGKELVRTKYDCSFYEKSLWSKLPSYSVLWKERKIFK
ncbi:putative mannosyltransferase [Brazilian marseillevirus]|uniref:putative mannosyltransferase n=1 Tax=Brazilian marseillevirus TaxID=1813599 RepID=UPI00078247F8|nr:putative mannosyltransferase [Brazilian marseillevirus]AMQ10672.1 putative mannosyltransferase [Brazilian marseillevirus]